MGRILAATRKSLVTKSLTALLVILFFSLANGGKLKAQDVGFHVGFRGGVGMTTLTGFENNGLKLGFTGGFCAQYNIMENQDLLTDFFYSSGGQLSQQWTDSDSGQLKIYSKYNLHYFNIPIIYQYYFTDILGIEAGPNFSYCFSGSLKTKIGNNGWHKTDFRKGDYNSFDFGLIIGVFTSQLIPNEDVFVSLRAYFGFCDVIKNVGSSKTIGVQVSIGYMLF